MSTEINKVTWTCSCEHENLDLMKETARPLCGGCDKDFDWEDISIDVNTYIGGDETTVKLGELFLIPKQTIIDGEELSKEKTKVKPFCTLIPQGWIPAYWGSFGEYVPVNF